MENKKFWLILDPYVHISIKRDSVLLYNTLNGKEIFYRNNVEILNFIKRLITNRNLMVIEITSVYLRNNITIFSFIKQLKKYFMGDLIEKTLDAKKPIQLIPRIKIRSEEVSQEGSVLNIGKEAMLNLSEISFYVNSQCDIECSVCSHAYKQFLFCFKREGRKIELELNKIKTLIDETRGSSLNKINILGGNIFFYRNLEKLVSFLNGLKVLKSYYIHYKNSAYHINKLSLIKNNLSELNILITFPIKDNIFVFNLSQIKNYKFKKNFIIPIQSNDDIKLAEELIKEHKMENYSLQPCFNGRNLSFFKKYVFLRKSHILESKSPIKTILSRSAINTGFYGKIYVLSNGKIYSNLNTPPLGKLSKDPLFDIVYKEMVKNRSWRKLRKHVEPCRRCVYENLCPPLSNYEFAIGKNNLCHIYK